MMHNLTYLIRLSPRDAAFPTHSSRLSLPSRIYDLCGGFNHSTGPNFAEIVIVKGSISPDVEERMRHGQNITPLP